MRKYHVWVIGVALALALGLSLRPAAAQDLTTMLSKFLVDLRAGTLGINQPISKIGVGDGSASAPSLTFASQPTMGLYRPAADQLMFADGTQATMGFANSQGFVLDAARALVWTNTSGNALATVDTNISRAAAGVVKLSNSTATATAEWQVSGGNGGFISSVKALTELTTIAAAATTNTAIQIPANAIVLGVSVRVVTVIPTAATFTVTSATPTKTWNTAAVTVAANSTDPGTLGAPSFQTTASAITITPNLTPGAATGQVRVTIYYYTITPPTS